MNARTWTCEAALLAVFVGVPPAHAFPDRASVPWSAASYDSARRADMNELVLPVRNDGMIAFDGTTNGGGLVFPKGSGKTVLFSGGPWIVAKVGGEWRGAIADFASEYAPGAMSGGVATDPLNAAYRVWKVRSFSQALDSTLVAVSTTDPLRDPIAHHSWTQYLAYAAPYGAPVRSRWWNGADSVDTPAPDVIGDQLLWSVFNDADPGRHRLRSGSTAPLGIEVRQSVFEFLQPGALANTVFLRLQILNRGGSTLDSMWVGFFTDPDVGAAGNDHIGSDSALALVYAYNAHWNDLVYGDAAPAIGYTLLRGPMVAGAPLGPWALTGPLKGSEEPQNILQSVHWVQGLQAGGAPRLDPDGNPARFWFDGDPVLGTGWLDPVTADRRMMLSTGPITMAPGDTQVVDVAIVVGQGVDNLASVENLRCEVDAVRSFYASGMVPNAGTVGPNCPTSVVESCPRPVSFWQQSCAGGLSMSDLTAVAQCVDESSDVLSFPSGQEATAFCALLDMFPPDPRGHAVRQYVAFLANRCGSKLGLATASDSVFLGDGIELWSSSTGARSVGLLAVRAESLLAALLTQPIEDDTTQTKSNLLRADLAMVNSGIGLGPTCLEDPSAEPTVIFAAASAGQVDMAWNLNAGAYAPVAVERRSGSTWTRVWRGPTFGAQIGYSDRNVPGGMQAYRLALNPDGRPATFAEFQVDVPAVPHTTLRLLRNPTPRVLSLGFTLQSAAPAMVEVYDLRGRLRASRRLAAPSIGSQVLDLDPGLEQGVYVVRVRQGDRSASAKVVILR